MRSDLYSTVSLEATTPRLLHTLSYAVDTILLIGVKLSNSVPVDRCTKVWYFVGDMNDHLITPAGLDMRTSCRRKNEYSDTLQEVVLPYGSSG